MSSAKPGAAPVEVAPPKPQGFTEKLAAAITALQAKRNQPVSRDRCFAETNKLIRHDMSGTSVLTERAFHAAWLLYRSKKRSAGDAGSSPRDDGLQSSSEAAASDTLDLDTALLVGGAIAKHCLNFHHPKSNSTSGKHASSSMNADTIIELTRTKIDVTDIPAILNAIAFRRIGSLTRTVDEIVPTIVMDTMVGKKHLYFDDFLLIAVRVEWASRIARQVASPGALTDRAMALVTFYNPDATSATVDMFMEAVKDAYFKPSKALQFKVAPPTSGSASSVRPNSSGGRHSVVAPKPLPPAAASRTDEALFEVLALGPRLYRCRKSLMVTKPLDDFDRDIAVTRLQSWVSVAKLLPAGYGACDPWSLACLVHGEENAFCDTVRFRQLVLRLHDLFSRFYCCESNPWRAHEVPMAALTSDLVVAAGCKWPSFTPLMPLTRALAASQPVERARPTRGLTLAELLDWIRAANIEYDKLVRCCNDAKVHPGLDVLLEIPFKVAMGRCVMELGSEDKANELVNLLFDATVSPLAASPPRQDSHAVTTTASPAVAASPTTAMTVSDNVFAFSLSTLSQWTFDRYCTLVAALASPLHRIAVRSDDFEKVVASGLSAASPTNMSDAQTSLTVVRCMEDYLNKHTSRDAIVSSRIPIGRVAASLLILASHAGGAQTDNLAFSQGPATPASERCLASVASVAKLLAAVPLSQSKVGHLRTDSPLWWKLDDVLPVLSAAASGPDINDLTQPSRELLLKLVTQIIFPTQLPKNKLQTFLHEVKVGLLRVTFSEVVVLSEAMSTFANSFAANVADNSPLFSSTASDSVNHHRRSLWSSVWEESAASNCVLDAIAAGGCRKGQGYVPEEGSFIASEAHTLQLKLERPFGIEAFIRLALDVPFRHGVNRLQRVVRSVTWRRSAAFESMETEIYEVPSSELPRLLTDSGALLGTYAALWTTVPSDTLLQVTAIGHNKPTLNVNCDFTFSWCRRVDENVKQALKRYLYTFPSSGGNGSLLHAVVDSAAAPFPSRLLTWQPRFPTGSTLRSWCTEWLPASLAKAADLLVDPTLRLRVPDTVDDLLRFTDVAKVLFDTLTPATTPQAVVTWAQWIVFALQGGTLGPADLPADDVATCVSVMEEMLAVTIAELDPGPKRTFLSVYDVVDRKVHCSLLFANSVTYTSPWMDALHWTDALAVMVTVNPRLMLEPRDGGRRRSSAQSDPFSGIAPLDTRKLRSNSLSMTSKTDDDGDEVPEQNDNRGDADEARPDPRGALTLDEAEWVMEGVVQGIATRCNPMNTPRLAVRSATWAELRPFRYVAERLTACALLPERQAPFRRGCLTDIAAWEEAPQVTIFTLRIMTSLILGAADALRQPTLEALRTHTMRLLGSRFDDAEDATVIEAAARKVQQEMFAEFSDQAEACVPTHRALGYIGDIVLLAYELSAVSGRLCPQSGVLLDTCLGHDAATDVLFQCMSPHADVPCAALPATPLAFGTSLWLPSHVTSPSHALHLAAVFQRLRNASRKKSSSAAANAPSKEDDPRPRA